MRIPERTINFNVYNATDNELLFCATVDLPELSFLTDEVSGSGIMGKYESPTQGSLDSMKVTLNYRTIDSSALRMLKHSGLQLDFRQATQVQDTLTGEYGSEGYYMSMWTCPPHSLTLGSAEAGGKNESKIELEVKALTIFFDDVEQLAIDKENFVFRVDGEDKLQKLKRDLGYDF